MAADSTLSRRLSEFLGVALFALALIWLIALVTYEPTDPVWFFTTNATHPPANFVGRVGAFIAELSFQLGRLYSTRHRDKEARAAFARTVAIAPGHADALFALARACQAERDFVEAEKIYRRMVAATPKDAAAKIGLGICLIELGRGEEALDHLRAASRTNDKMFGEAVGALADAGKGRFWLRPSAAARALREDKS